MIELDLSLHRKTRIWINKLPMANFDPVITLEHEYSILDKSLQNLKYTSIAIELSIPVGARVIYGLLGAEFYPNTSNQFSFKVYSSDSVNANFDNSLNQGQDIAYIGLPLPYSKSVKKEVLQFFEDVSRFKPRGELLFNCGAYSEVGSNQRIFEQLTIIICNYLFSGREFEKENDFLDLFGKIL